MSELSISSKFFEIFIPSSGCWPPTLSYSIPDSKGHLLYTSLLHKTTKGEQAASICLFTAFAFSFWEIEILRHNLQVSKVPEEMNFWVLFDQHKKISILKDYLRWKGVKSP